MGNGKGFEASGYKEGQGAEWVGAPRICGSQKHLNTYTTVYKLWNAIQNKTVLKSDDVDGERW